MTDQEVFSGEVAWFDPKRGFGFLVWEKDGVKQPDMFVHFSDVSCEGFKTLQQAQKVTFEVGANKNGQPKAVNVMIAKK